MADTLPVFRPLATDHKDTAERAWCAPSKAAVAQKACDHGLFSDDSLQTDLFTSTARK